ncbi:MAG: Ig domain-containing protein [Candidatus Korobacteraceae bacterium]
MAYRSIPKTRFLLIVCLLSYSSAFANSAASTVTGSDPGLPGVISGGYYLQPYSAALQSSFGTPPYTYTLVAGALPPGITMNSAGKITGTPADTGVFNFQIKATDSSKPPMSKTSAYSLNISIGSDTYGGLTAAHSAKPATGYFHLEEQNGRWKLISPLGNDFYLFSVFNANESFLESWVIPQRYRGDAELWAAHRGERMLSWGFNTLGEYTCFRGLPVGTWGSKDGNSVKLPFIFFMSGAADSLYHPSDVGIAEPIKQIINGIPSSTYNCNSNYCGVGVLDVFDPKWAQTYAGEVTMNQKIFTGGFANVPWMIGITTEDADFFWPLKGIGSTGYPNMGWLVAVTNFQQSGFKDPKLYSKYAWVAYLQQKYGTIAKLNAAWGSNYTTFVDNGGFGVGTGVLDEDGRHKWIGTDPYGLKGETAALQADMNAFLYLYVYQTESVAVKAIRSYDKNHMIFAPSALGGYGAIGIRPQVLQALADAGVDALAIDYDPLRPQNVSTITQAYDLTGKPTIVWYGVTANQDSYWHGYPSGGADYPTQETRGLHYNSDLSVLYSAKATNGDHPILGLDFWSLTDSGRGEATNWGLMSDRDNSYDGKAAIVAPGTDKWGFATGGEDLNYGDFLDKVTQTNLNTVKQFIVESH